MSTPSVARTAPPPKSRRPRRFDANVEDELTRLLRAQARDGDPYRVALVTVSAVMDTTPEDVTRVLRKLQNERPMRTPIPPGPLEDLERSLEAATMRKPSGAPKPSAPPSAGDELGHVVCELETLVAQFHGYRQLTDQLVVELTDAVEHATGQSVWGSGGLLDQQGFLQPLTNLDMAVYGLSNHVATSAQDLRNRTAAAARQLNLTPWRRAALEDAK